MTEPPKTYKDRQRQHEQGQVSVFRSETARDLKQTLVKFPTSGDAYRVALDGSLRSVRPKAKGKAARRAEKLKRRKP